MAGLAKSRPATAAGAPRAASGPASTAARCAAAPPPAGGLPGRARAQRGSAGARTHARRAAWRGAEDAGARLLVPPRTARGAAHCSAEQPAAEAALRRPAAGAGLSNLREAAELVDLRAEQRRLRDEVQAEAAQLESLRQQAARVAAGVASRPVCVA